MAKKPRRWRRRALIGAASGAALVFGGAALGLGPLAPWLVDTIGDGLKIGRLGHLRIEGVSGGSLAHLKVRAITLSDDNGVWAEAHDVALDWRPLGVFTGTVHVDQAEFGAISILRQPKLSPAQPSGPSPIDIIGVDALHIAHLDIAEPVFGAAAAFTATAGVDWRKDDLRALDLTLTRLDSEADHVNAHLRAGVGFALQFDAASAPGGVLARALGVADDGVTLTATGEGRGPAGTARLEGMVGAKPLIGGALEWNAARWSVHAQAALDLLPATESVAQRLGNTVTLQAFGAPRANFTAHAETPFLAADLAGALDEHWALVGPAHLVAATTRISAIAREAPFEFGAARFDGVLRPDHETFLLQGVLDGRDLNILNRRARLTGPVRAALTPDRFTLEADLRAPADAPALFAHARLRTAMNVDRRRGRYTLERAQLQGDAIAIDAQGWAHDGDGQFSGNWRLRQFGALFPGLNGEAGGRWRAFAAQAPHDTHIWSAAVDGQGARITGAPEIIPQLLGGDPRLDALFRFERGGVSVEHARIDGAQIRAGASGRIVHGQSDLRLEASARGPLSIGDARIDGAVDATGQLTGAIVRPTLRAHAQLASFTAAGVDITQPDIVFTLAPAGNAYRGQGEMQGRYGAQPVSAISSLVIADSALSLPDLVTHVAALEAHGQARLSPRGAEAQLILGGALDGLAEGLSGRVTGHAALTPQTLTLDAQIADAHAGDLRVRAATITASGPYRAIEARFDLRGALRRAPLTFAGTAAIHALNTGTDVDITGRGALAGADVSSRTPIRVHWGRDALDAALDVALADGGLTARWRERGRVLQGVATIGETPLAPLAAIWGERATGRIGGRIELVNTGGGLKGDADVTLTDARFAGRQRGALTGRFTAHLEPNRLTASLDANSSDGLAAHFEADAPVTTSAAPILIALAPERRGSARWSMRGPAGALWAATRLPDQDLEGDVSGEGQLSFGAGYLAGDGRIQIAHGRFEDKVSGVKLQDLDAAIVIGSGGVTIERFTATDGRDGRISATGGSANPREGHIALELRDLRLIDRPDARARANGQLNFAWAGTDATLGGALVLKEADISVAQNPQAGIPTLDVVEINRPGDEDDEHAPQDRQALGATALNVRITAPGRIFTRGRGVEAEWALDMRLGGTSAAPQLFGQAQALRGTISLSGQPFDIDSGTIFFNGAPNDARIQLAATRDTADLTAHILLSGTAADPDISFTSDPGLPEDEILPQILFGHSVQDLNALEAAQLAASLAALSGQASFNLVDAARAAAGLDRFNVRQDASGGFLVAGGVYLTRQVYVEVARTGLGQAATRVEWTIRPKLVLITSFLANGDQRASIRWRRESD